MEVCPGEAGDEAGTVLGISDDEKTRMKVTPPLAVAPIAQEDDMRWNPNDDGIVFDPYVRALRARSPRQACPRNIPQESSKFYIYGIMGSHRKFMH